MEPFGQPAVFPSQAGKWGTLAGVWRGGQHWGQRARVFSNLLGYYYLRGPQKLEPKVACPPPLLVSCWKKGIDS